MHARESTQVLWFPDAGMMRMEIIRIYVFNLQLNYYQGLFVWREDSAESSEANWSRLTLFSETLFKPSDDFYYFPYPNFGMYFSMFHTNTITTGDHLRV